MLKLLREPRCIAEVVQYYYTRWQPECERESAEGEGAGRRPQASGWRSFSSYDRRRPGMC